MLFNSNKSFYWIHSWVRQTKKLFTKNGTLHLFLKLFKKIGQFCLILCCCSPNVACVAINIFPMAAVKPFRQKCKTVIATSSVTSSHEIKSNPNKF